MRCPTCKNKMTELKVLDLSVDVCVGGCGGVWFDWYELKKVEEQHTAQGVQLLLAPCQEVSLIKKPACPRCEATALVPHFSSKRRDVQVVECPNCSGFFLAHGDLNRMCQQTGSGPKCAAAITRLLADLAGEGLIFRPEERVLGQSHVHGMILILRLILPNSTTSSTRDSSLGF